MCTSLGHWNNWGEFIGQGIEKKDNTWNCDRIAKVRVDITPHFGQKTEWSDQSKIRTCRTDTSDSILVNR